MLANYLCFRKACWQNGYGMKSLNGKELAEFIKERQVHSAWAYTGHATLPRLAIIRTNPTTTIGRQLYEAKTGLRYRYWRLTVDVHTIDQADATAKIAELNRDDTVHGIIVQIPLPDPAQTTEILNTVSVDKDVDGLAVSTKFDPATPMAISWLLAGYNVELRAKNIVVVGHGKACRQALVHMWQQSGLEVTVVDEHTSPEELTAAVKEADILVCATGVPSLITASMVKPTAVIVDAGVATDSNGLVGDIAPDVRELPNITITPKQGGVGPLTVCALFENVLRAATKVSQQLA